jgi:hypothetical protein
LGAVTPSEQAEILELGLALLNKVEFLGPRRNLFEPVVTVAAEICV